MKAVSGINCWNIVVSGLFAIGVGATPSGAESPIYAQGQPNINCTCRYQGQDYQQGDMICLKSPEGPQLARCGFVQNNTSWNFTGMGCLYSAADRYIPKADGLPRTGVAVGRITLQ